MSGYVLLVSIDGDKFTSHSRRTTICIDPQIVLFGLQSTVSISTSLAIVKCTNARTGLKNGVKN
jgi:hypothetical protein